MSGRLFIVSTPIGNLADISSRVKETLDRASVVLAEDTRVTGKLLHHLQIKVQMLSCHDFNEVTRFRVLEDAAAEGKDVVVVSDAGTPLVSDPGFQLVRRAIELGLTVVPIPGPSAVLTALVGSGLPCDRFTFEGFLPEKKGDRRRRLEKLKTEERTLVFYIAPSNLADTLVDMLDTFGDRDVCLARELTKLHEEFIRKPLSKLSQQISEELPRGEFVLVVSGAAESEAKIVPEEFVQERLLELLNSGGRLKEVAAILAKETGWASSAVYKLGLSIKEGMDNQS